MTPTDAAPPPGEGDANTSPRRAAWRAGLSAATRDLLDRDERVFLRQSLSTPCLDALAACGLKPPRLSADDSGGFAATSLPTLVQMVGSGLGVSFVPAMAVEAGLAKTADIAVRPLKADHPTREIVVAWRAGSEWLVSTRFIATISRMARSPKLPGRKIALS